jgi:hypothetical protein
MKPHRRPRNERKLVMFCTGTLKLEHALHAEKPTPCACANCGGEFEKGERICCYQDWALMAGEAASEEDHGWERDYLGGELVYEWRDW